MTEDVVAELDRWRTTTRTAENAHEFVPMSELLIRAREEIVGLRATVERQRAVLAQGHAEVRDAALDEAARACDERGATTGSQDAYAVLDVESYKSACGGCAYDIRALKERGDE